jgi:hypothetical protein
MEAASGVVSGSDMYSGRRLYTCFEVMSSPPLTRHAHNNSYPSTGLILTTAYLQYLPLLIFLHTWQRRAVDGCRTWKHRVAAAVTAAFRMCIYVHPGILNFMMAVPMEATTMGSTMTRWT